MGGGQTELEPSPPHPGRLKKGRGRGLRAEGKRPTVLHTHLEDHTADSSRRALLQARQEALARLCQERWDSYCTELDFGPPPLSAEPESLPEEESIAPEVQPNRVPASPLDTVDPS